MEKKTMDTLRAMICGEVEDIAKKGTLSHETLDILKDLIETEKNLVKIEKYEEEKKEKEMGMDMGYSQRKFFIDADYQPGMAGNSYARGGRAMYGMNNSYAGGNSYGYDMYGNNSYARGGNSYMYDPRYEMPMHSMVGQGYSRTGSKMEMVEELKGMMQEATDETTKAAISDAITRMSK